MDAQPNPFSEDGYQDPKSVKPEAKTLTFIFKIWVEDVVGEEGKAFWRGSITHVGTGERQFIRNLEEISEKITPYLVDLGVNI